MNIYLILLYIFLGIIYIGLFWGLPLLQYFIDKNLKRYLFMVFFFHVGIVIITGTAFLIAFLVNKTGLF